MNKPATRNKNLTRRHHQQRLTLLALTLAMSPASVLAEEVTPSLQFLEYLGMSTELEEIGIETEKIDTETQQIPSAPADADTDTDKTTAITPHRKRQPARFKPGHLS